MLNPLEVFKAANQFERLTYRLLENAMAFHGDGQFRGSGNLSDEEYRELSKNRQLGWVVAAAARDLNLDTNPITDIVEKDSLWEWPEDKDCLKIFQKALDISKRVATDARIECIRAGIVLVEGDASASDAQLPVPASPSPKESVAQLIGRIRAIRRIAVTIGDQNYVNSHRGSPSGYLEVVEAWMKAIRDSHLPSIRKYQSRRGLFEVFDATDLISSLESYCHSLLHIVHCEGIDAWAKFLALESEVRSETTRVAGDLDLAINTLRQPADDGETGAGGADISSTEEGDPILQFIHDANSAITRLNSIRPHLPFLNPPMSGGGEEWHFDNPSDEWRLDEARRKIRDEAEELEPLLQSIRKLAVNLNLQTEGIADLNINCDDLRYISDGVNCEEQVLREAIEEARSLAMKALITSIKNNARSAELPISQTSVDVPTPPNGKSHSLASHFSPEAAGATVSSAEAVKTVAPDESPSLVLGSESGPHIVCGISKPKITGVQYDVVKALIIAGDTGLTLDAIKKIAPSGRDAIDKLRKDGDWKRVIIMSGEGKTGYRILNGRLQIDA